MGAIETILVPILVGLFGTGAGWIVKAWVDRASRATELARAEATSEGEWRREYMELRATYLAALEKNDELGEMLNKMRGQMRAEQEQLEELRRRMTAVEERRVEEQEVRRQLMARIRELEKEVELLKNGKGRS